MSQNLNVKTVKGRALPLTGDDIDTDRIIPARYLKCVTFDELGQYAFYDERFREDGTKKNHPFNDPRYKGASILIVNKNFGCGSSREHAPQSLMRFGINGIIGESFAEIFADNCTTLGIPVVVAQKSDIGNLMSVVKDDPACEVRIDLESKEVCYGDFSIPIHQQESSRRVLVEGTWDSMAVLKSAAAETKQLANRLPYLKGFQEDA